MAKDLQKKGSAAAWKTDGKLIDIISIYLLVFWCVYVFFSTQVVILTILTGSQTELYPFRIHFSVHKIIPSTGVATSLVSLLLTLHADTVQLNCCNSAGTTQMNSYRHFYFQGWDVTIMPLVFYQSHRYRNSDKCVKKIFQKQFRCGASEALRCFSSYLTAFVLNSMLLFHTTKTTSKLPAPWKTGSVSEGWDTQ